MYKVMKFLNHPSQVYQRLVSLFLKSSSSSSKFLPTFAILSQKCYLVWLKHAFNISKQALNLCQKRCTLPNWFLFPMLRCIKGIQSDRLIIWHTENVTKKLQLPASDTFHQRLSVGHSIDSGISDMICPFLKYAKVKRNIYIYIPTQKNFELKGQ